MSEHKKVDLREKTLLKTQIIEEVLESGLAATIKGGADFSKDDFHKIKNKIYGKYKLAKPIPSIELIERYNELLATGEMEESLFFKKILRKRGVRSQSGVTVISLLTKFWGCPGKCVYCPTFDGLPKSYIPNEPAVMRAELNKFDPIKQIHNRLRALEITGHKIEKNDIRIIGGTWSFYPKEYQEDFMKGIYDAFNTYDEMTKYIEKSDLSTDRFATFKINQTYKAAISSSLEEAKKLNQTSRCRIIGIAIETRPDWITPEEIARLRGYGVTRVEIGYQTTFDAINELNKRGHGNKESIQATQLLKDAGFKVVAHMMPNLLGSTPDMDKKSLAKVFDDQAFRPDELKIYPMVVTDKSELTEIWKEGGFKAYDDETLINLTADLEAMIPEYIRLNRTYRDIPATEILEGSKLANLRQIVEKKLKAEGRELIDVRQREIKFGKNDPKNAELHDYHYEASNGYEHFLTFEDPTDRTIFSLMRLRLPGYTPSTGISVSSSQKELFNLMPELKGAALIREIHTFGDQLSIGEKGTTFGQHLGFGKRLIIESERLAKEAGFKKLAVIAGVGVRQYYEKRGYTLEGEYMVKDI
ncbi:MAG: tRNA uridine(34) 5-carboxymethylaminomethyl modification radical SAM/GNAT enzyme Elp3 [Candidatus Gracilibacteria bacterium]|nr:tRNA uridine(34) 5-carboxymethylaminomethyl modification radical SAM/GNAT enzyme Elp3 [Candidatus Gracilibacteria bacterium]